MRDADVDVVSMEVSSHALDQSRVLGVDFAVACFTNLRSGEGLEAVEAFLLAQLPAANG